MKWHSGVWKSELKRVMVWDPSQMESFWIPWMLKSFPHTLLSSLYPLPFLPSLFSKLASIMSPRLASVSQRSLCLHLTLSYVFIIFVLLKINSILTQYILIIVSTLSTPPNVSQPPLASRFTYFLSLVIKGQGSKIYQRWENRIK